MSCSERTKDATVDNASNADTELQHLKLTLELIDNNYQNKRQSQSLLTFTNNGKEAFPATGWKLYFNSGGLRTADTTIAQIKHVNGDLQSLLPGPNFGTLEPGGSKKVEVLGGGY